MFFKKKPKIDSRVRYQHSAFTKAVRAASQYHRVSSPVPDGRLAKFLRGLGLDSWRRGLIVALILVAAIYVIYIPNPLFIKTIEVSGGSEEVNNQVRSQIQQYLSQYQSLAPGRNSLFVSPSSLSYSIKQKNFLVMDVELVENNYRGTLTVKINQKIEAFTFVTNHGAFVAYNDGMVKELLAQGAPIRGLGVRLPTDTFFESNRKYMDDQFAKDLEEIVKYFPASSGLKLDSVVVSVPVPTQTVPEPIDQEPVPAESETPTKSDGAAITPIEAPKPPTIEMSSEHPYKPEDFRIEVLASEIGPKFSVIVDTASSMQDMMGRLDSVITQLDAGKRAALVYIDLRYAERGYICLSGTRCAQDFLDPTPAPVENPPGDKDSSAAPKSQ